MSELIALKSSNYRDRSSNDKKSDRAYHLVRFIGTDAEAAPPQLNAPPPVRAKRELVPPPQVSEEEKKQGLDKLERKPGETQDAFEIRRRVRNRKKEEEWKWTFENGDWSTRWDGKEDHTQQSHYVLVFPAEAPGQPHPVALLDQWIDARRFIDNSGHKKKIKDENFFKKLRMAKQRMNDEFIEHEEQMEFREMGVSRSKNESVSWVVGREDEDLSKSREYQTRGTFGDDDDMPQTNTMGGERVEDIDLEDNIVDHEHGLAVDRVQNDGDDFGDNPDFDDDDDGVQDVINGEGREGLDEGEAVVRMAVDVEELKHLDEDDDQSRILEHVDEEDEGDAVVPTDTPAKRGSLPLPATKAPPPAPKPKTTEEIMKDSIIQTMRKNNNKITSISVLIKAYRAGGKPLAPETKTVFADVVKATVRQVKSEIEGTYYTLKDNVI